MDTKQNTSNQILESTQISEKKNWSKPKLSKELGILDTKANYSNSGNDGNGWAS